MIINNQSPVQRGAGSLPNPVPRTAAELPVDTVTLTASQASDQVGPPLGWKPPADWNPYKGQPVDSQGHLLLDQPSGMSGLQTVGLVADLLGIVDPTPICDLVGGGVSLLQGDGKGAMLSGISALVPYAGDALAKPVKLALKMAEHFPGLVKFTRNLDRLKDLAQTLKVAGPRAERGLSVLNKMSNDAAKAYERADWLKFAQKQHLPHDGPIPFVPPSRFNPANPQKGPNGGLMDAYGNEWTKGPSRTPGQTHEWDVIPKGEGGISAFAGDARKSHVNVSWDGVVTH